MRCSDFSPIQDDYAALSHPPDATASSGKRAEARCSKQATSREQPNSMDMNHGRREGEESSDLAGKDVLHEEAGVARGRAEGPTGVNNHKLKGLALSRSGAGRNRFPEKILIIASA